MSKKQPMTAQSLSSMGLVEISPGIFKKSKGLEAVKIWVDGLPCVFEIEPMGKPRMTQRDKWLKPPRKPVELYWEYKDKLVEMATRLMFDMPESEFGVKFVLPMPHSWSKKKRDQMDGAPHKQKPDLDNLMKALQDCLCKEDSFIHHYECRKVWGISGKIIIQKL